MVYLTLYALFGLLSLVALIFFELRHAQEIRWAKPSTIFRSSILVIIFWPWIVPLYIYERISK